MNATVPVDVSKLYDELDVAEHDAQALVTGLTEDQGTRRLHKGRCSIAEYVDRLATADTVCLQAMLEPVSSARALGMRRFGTLTPGFGGRLFIFQNGATCVRWWSKLRAPRKIKPRIRLHRFTHVT